MAKIAALLLPKVFGMVSSVGFPMDRDRLWGLGNPDESGQVVLQCGLGSFNSLW
ncbi:MAG: hypothetical protein Q7J86_13180 [Bacteroidota bacterium]|nr:hypothetical protein [Bacteroidota bacterium]MDP3435190.1 hypothetical protein [Bacteroidota bacterium]